MTRGEGEARRRGEDEGKDFASSSPRVPASSVLDYLPDETLIFIEDAEELALVIDELETQARTLKQNLIDVGDLPGNWPDPYFGWSDLALPGPESAGVGLHSLKTTTDRRPPTAEYRPETGDRRRERKT
jgi:hypothetical protein